MSDVWPHDNQYTFREWQMKPRVPFIAFVPGSVLSLHGKARRRARKLYPQDMVVTIKGCRKVWGLAMGGRRTPFRYEVKVGFMAQIVCKTPGYNLEITL